MVRKIFVGGINRMGSVKNPEARKHQLVPQNPLDTNMILEVYLALHREWKGAIPTTNVYVSLCLNHV